MTIYNIADILTGVAESVMMIMLCTTFCTKREGFPVWAYAVGYIALAVAINISNTIFNIGIMNVILMILSFFAVTFLYEIKMSTRIVIAVLQYLILVITEVTVLFAITLIYHITVSEVVNSNYYRLLGIIISKMLAFSAVNLIRYKYRGKRYMGTSYWILFFVMFLTSVATVFLIFKLSYNTAQSYMYDLSVLCSFGLMLSTVFALYLYEYLTRQAETIRNQEQYEQQLKTQLKHIDDILATQRQMKKFKHDFNNYIIGLKSYINNNDFKGASDYIGTLDKKFNCGKDIIETGNTAFDAILSTKIAIARSKKITVNTKIQIPEHISVDPTDICIIFGNALDNAIEACDRSELNDKEIDISILCKGEAVLCKISNTTPPPDNLTLGTSKTDKSNHGFGLENIKTALAKYNASPNIEITDTRFILKFVIFIN